MMMRERLPDRRLSMNERVVFTTANGNEQNVIVTFGFDPGTRKVREVFTASFKVGTDMNAIISDACVMASLLMQHGYAPRQVFERLGAPPSLLGAIMLAASEIDERRP